MNMLNYLINQPHPCYSISRDSQSVFTVLEWTLWIIIVMNQSCYMHSLHFLGLGLVNWATEQQSNKKYLKAQTVIISMVFSKVQI